MELKDFVEQALDALQKRTNTWGRSPISVDCGSNSKRHRHVLEIRSDHFF